MKQKKVFLHCIVINVALIGLHVLEIKPVLIIPLPLRLNVTTFYQMTLGDLIMLVIRKYTFLNM